MSFLVADNLTKRYDKLTALDDFSVTVEQGEIVAMVGPDGAGKTTAIRIMCHLLKADSGTVMIDGIDVAKSPERIKPILGYMPQQFSLYPDLSIEENMTFYAGLYGLTGAAYRAKRDYLYEFSNLARFAKRRAQALSGGMKQKLALSCALIHDPKLLILDEPTTGVDPVSRRQFWEILQQLKQEGVSILVSTPYMDEVARCDRAAFVLGGRRLSLGTPSELAGSFKGQIFYIDAEPSPQLVAQLNEIDGVEAVRFGAGLHMYLAFDDKLDNHIAALRGIGLDPAKITAIKPDLEDRFIQLMETPA